MLDKWLHLILVLGASLRVPPPSAAPATGEVKRGLENRVGAPVFYGNLREKTVFHEYLQEAWFILTEISGNLREFMGECNLGIHYRSSLLEVAPRAARANLNARPAPFLNTQTRPAQET